MTDPYVVIIPSRLASTRLPRKPLADIAGKSLIQRVYERAIQSKARKVYVATDEKEIFNHVRSFSDDVIMTSENHISGTDRIQEAANVINIQPNETIINLQGDEPFVPIDLINNLSNVFNNSSCDVGTVVSKFSDADEVDNPNSVKVALSNSNKALYFSRSVIPDNFTKTDQIFYRHIGIYAYKKSTLDRLVSLPPSSLELLEKLEQLRFIENGFTIEALIYNSLIPSGIDTQEDLQSAVDFINNAHK